MNTKNYLTLLTLITITLHLNAQPSEPNMRQIFNRVIFEWRLWQHPETLCGPGSTLAETEIIRKELPVFLNMLNIKTMLDIPCGDLNWMKEVDLKIEKYIGADIVEKFISDNKRLYERNDREFIVLDASKDKLPKVDLILCKDLLIHFSYKEIISTLRNFKESGAKYLLVSTYMGIKSNRDIKIGSFRPVNLQIKPFNFPDPIFTIKHIHINHEQELRVLALWRLEDIEI